MSATDVSNVLRVSFALEIGEHRQCEVVCFVRPEDLRLGIYYSHHVWRHRVTPTSAWETQNTLRVPMTPQLESEIRIQVPNELWLALAKHVRVLPGDVGSKISMLRFE